jgi:hypothetical protein
MNRNTSQGVRRKLLPLGLTLAVSLLLAGGLFWLNHVATVSANTSDFSLAESTYSTIVGSRIDNCALCHSGVPSLNPFGAAYKAGGRGSASSLTNIANLDSDGDGFSNIQEINAHTYPGDAVDFPLVATVTSTNTPLPSPTATVTKLPTSTSTAVPTATQVGPTATQPAPTATQVGPTATQPAPTATLVGPTATKPAATATLVGPTATKLAATATKIPRMTGTPGVKPTPVKQCIKDDDDYRKLSKERERSEGKKRPNPCPPNYHDREDKIEHQKENDSKSNENVINQAWNKISGWFSGKNH